MSTARREYLQNHPEEKNNFSSTPARQQSVLLWLSWMMIGVGVVVDEAPKDGIALSFSIVVTVG